MSGFLLDQHEKDRFVLWLEQQAESNEAIIEQFKKMQVPEAVIKHHTTEAVACRMVADMLRSGETVTLKRKESG